MEPATAMQGTAVVICDTWDICWGRGANERLAVLAPRVNAFVAEMRSRGALIVHAPSDVVAVYAGSPARRRIVEAPHTAPPTAPIWYWTPLDPPLPIDDSDGGSDTGETTPEQPWTRQHPAIVIDDERDVISEEGPEIYGYLRHREIEKIYLVGVHANMCILRRSFGIRNLRTWDLDVTLVGDLTDSMYNPAMPPFVSHERGTELVLEYIAEHWCPVTTSAAVLAT